MARKKYEMKTDARAAQIIRSCFVCNIVCLSLGIFAYNTFYFILDVLILAMFFPYLKFEYRRLNKAGVSLRSFYVDYRLYRV